MAARGGRPAPHRRDARGHSVALHCQGALRTFRGSWMSIWLELLVLLLVAYAIGLAIGWAIWGRHSGETHG